MKKNLELTPSTAHKRSHYTHEESIHFPSVSNLSHSPNLLTPTHRRNGSGISSKISSLRSTIGVQRVYDVNSELCDNFSHEEEFPRALSVNSLRVNPAEERHKTSFYG